MLKFKSGMNIEASEEKNFNYRCHSWCGYILCFFFFLFTILSIVKSCKKLFALKKVASFYNTTANDIIINLDDQFSFPVLFNLRVLNDTRNTTNEEICEIFNDKNETNDVFSLYHINPDTNKKEYIHIFECIPEPEDNPSVAIFRHKTFFDKPILCTHEIDHTKHPECFTF